MDYHVFGREGFLGRALTPYCTGNQNSPVWINCMAKVMGIGGNKKHPAKMMTENLKSALQVFELAIANGCKRIVNFGSTCAYAKNAFTPFHPYMYMSGEPESSNYGYAMAKRAILALSQVYSEEFHMDNLYLVMPNLYGPGCHFGPNNHVIPEMIVKIQKATDENQTEIVFMGTGTAQREFLYIQDAAQLVLQAIGECHTPELVHLTSGQLITIRDLAYTLCEMMEFKGRVLWDRVGPDGQMRRQLARGIELQVSTPLETGLQATIRYYREVHYPQSVDHVGTTR